MSEININELILEELRGLRTEVNAGFSETKQRITAVETHVEPFFATDGGKVKIEADIADLQKSKWYALGGLGAIGGLHLLLRKFGVNV